MIDRGDGCWAQLGRREFATHNYFDLLYKHMKIELIMTQVPNSYIRYSDLHYIYDPDISISLESSGVVPC